MATSPTFNRPDNIHSALQFNVTTGEPELRVNLGSDAITITGSVNVGTVVQVESTPTNPVHTHVSEIGTSGILAVPYMPIGGSVSISNFPATQTVNGALSISNFPATQAVTGTFWQATQPISGAVSVSNFPATQTVNGTLAVTQSGPWTVASSTTDLIIADSDYEMNLARGILTGQAIVTRNGYNPDVNQDVETSIWVEGGLYPFGAWTVASPLYIASNNVADISQNIVIQGLDANYDMQSETIILNGTSTVVTTKSWIRIYSGVITSSVTTVANIGDILFRISSAGGTVVAHIAPNMGMTKLSQYTIPRNKTGYILFGDATSFRSGSGNIGTQIRMYVRQYNGPFVGVHVAEVVNGHYRNDFNVPLAIPARGDIDVRCFADANNTIITCSYQLILVDN